MDSISQHPLARFSYGQAYLTLSAAQLLLFCAAWIFMWPSVLGIETTPQLAKLVSLGLVVLAAAGFYVSLSRLFLDNTEVGVRTDAEPYSTL